MYDLNICHMKLSDVAGTSRKSSQAFSNCLLSPQNLRRLNFHTFPAFTCKIETSFNSASSSFGFKATPPSWKLTNQFPTAPEPFRVRARARCQGLRLKAALAILSAFALLVDVVSTACGILYCFDVTMTGSVVAYLWSDLVQLYLIWLTVICD